ncbi:hypothetical protein HJFPF1_11075 [Paramyrothecium foliicola]|nr:hypothetical protein HJFPF1_11075 [Paramyrothecium foliicola]
MDTSWSAHGISEPNQMRFFTLITVPLAMLVQQVSANFDLYSMSENDWTGGHTDQWKIFATDPSCSEVANARIYWDTNDVSGTKTGVRCKGNGCWNNYPSQVDELEMHFSNNPLYHWTIYKNRGHPYKMYGLDGKTYGECIMFPNNDYHCPILGSTISGVRMFRCLTKFTAAQIQAAR